MVLGCQVCCRPVSEASDALDVVVAAALPASTAEANTAPELGFEPSLSAGIAACAFMWAVE